MTVHRQDSLAVLIFTILLIFLPLATSSCYFPNGTQDERPEYQECAFSNGDISMCCATNRTNPSGGSFTKGNTADTCLSNGLCMNQGANAANNKVTTYWRDTCTSSNWSDGCLSVCTDDAREGNGSSTIRMTSCDGTPTSETWCCGLNNTECCNSDKAITIAANFGSSTLTSTPSTSPSGSPSADNFSTGLSDGAKAGIGVAAAVGGLAIVAVFAFWLIRQRRQKSTGDVDMAGVPTGPVYQGYTAVQDQGPGELDGRGMAHEKPAGVEDIRHELPGESTHR